MRIHVKVSTVVKPRPEKPRTTIWLSNLDIIFLENRYVSTLYFYHYNATDNFFESTLLKSTLAQTVSEFYPIAGRLKMDDNGRVEIDCNGQGVVFMEAEAEGEIKHLGDFAPRPDICLAPLVDYTQEISAYPLFLVQVTRFKCGGVCLGFSIQHQAADGISALQIINTWSDIARGGQMVVTPHFDRRLLAARNPPRTNFDHVEFYPAPSFSTENLVSEPRFSVLKLTHEQLKALKSNCQEDHGKRPSYTLYEVLAGHVWKCMCKARGLLGDQETKLTMVVDVRSRVQPALPQGYFGNAVLKAAGVGLSGEIESSTLKQLASKIHKTLERLDDEYLRSAIDFLELSGGLPRNERSMAAYNCPNLGITSWARLPLYNADFGWGRPSYVGLGTLPVEGQVTVMASSDSDGSLSVALLLPEQQMKLFQKLFYEF